MHDNNIMGKNFFWWTGVVEGILDNEKDDYKDDEYKLGRVRVRILGLHSPKYEQDTPEGEGIKPEELHWAMPMQPITSAGVSGIGTTPLGPVPGSWVFGFSRDGEFSQDLVIMGTFGAMEVEPKNPLHDGFGDPAEIFPLALDEEDTNRLARNDDLEHPILEPKRETLVEKIHRANDGEWDQPDIQYEAEYPYNHVRESYHEKVEDWGHVEEWDMTPGKERMHKWHKSQTYEEIYANGDKVVRVVGDNYDITFKDHNIYARGNVSISADRDVYIYAKNDIEMEADHNIHMVAHNNIIMHADNSIHSTAIRHITENAGLSITEVALKDVISSAGMYRKEFAGLNIEETSIFENITISMEDKIKEFANLNIEEMSGVDIINVAVENCRTLATYSIYETALISIEEVVNSLDSEAPIPADRPGTYPTTRETGIKETISYGNIENTVINEGDILHTVGGQLDDNEGLISGVGSIKNLVYEGDIASTVADTGNITETIGGVTSNGVLIEAVGSIKETIEELVEGNILNTNAGIGNIVETVTEGFKKEHVLLGPIIEICDEGNILMNAAKVIITVTEAEGVVIIGNITHTGDNNQDGIHEDTIGKHDA